MTRNSRSNNRSRNNRSGRARVTPATILSGIDRTITVPGKTLVPFTIPALNQLVSIPVNIAGAALGPRLTALGGVYDEFKFSMMSIRIHPAQNSLGVQVPYALCYFKTIPANVPTTMQQAYEATCSRFMNVGDTVPQQLTIPRSALLHGIRPWYDTDTSSGTTTEDNTQGVLYLVTNGPLAAGVTLSINVEIGYICMFRGSTNPAID
jgi:hypothetical protein